jgi:oxygen-dependent protoporphyrinogen oxidase
MTTRLTVVGGGITGLAAAWEAVQRGASVTVLEAAPRLGGKIETDVVDGVPVDSGADAFLARVPWATDLCRELGLGPSLVSPAAGRALVWWRGRLRPLPEAMLLGVPTDVLGVARSGLLSPWGLARAALDFVLPASALDDDLSVADVVGRRLGRQVVERLVDPLVGGINAGRSDELSATAVVPQLVAAARAHRSLVVGARRSRPGGAVEGPVFVTVREGLGRLVERLGAALRDAGAVIETGVAVSTLDDIEGPMVLAVPAGAAADLVRRRSPDAAEELASIRYASVALATFAYPADAFPAMARASGFLVPRSEGRLLTACSFGTNKWPHWAPPGQVVVRASAGRVDDERAMALDDETLAQRLHAELVEAVGASAEPTVARVHRWAKAFPQYAVGHLDKVERIERALAERAPEVVVAGAAYRGLGIPACVKQGRDAAARLVPST